MTQRLRVLGVGDHCDLGDMYVRLGAQGHEVRVCVREPEAHDMLAGLVTQVPDWRAQLAWVRDNGIIIFETAHDGALQDELRRDGFRVIGGGAFGDRLEGDRAFGQAMMREMGLATAHAESFTDFAAGAAYARAQQRRLVFKMNGEGIASWRNYVGQSEDGSDVAAYLDALAQRWPDPVSFILMDFLHGVEMGVGAYFDGDKFLTPACLDWEHKRFFPSDLGELTGEMGTVVTYSGSEPFFARTLAKLAPQLRAHGYCGYINLNTIVNAEGIWPLEFTSRFGYPGFAILSPLQQDGWGALLHALAFGGETSFAAQPGFAVGVVLTVPPFPYRFGYAEVSRGSLVLFAQSLTAAERDHLHYGEVGLDARGALVACGSVGYLMVATGVGPDVAQAREHAYGVARKVICPNLRYRDDIGEKLIAGDLAQLRQWGYFAD